MNNRSKQPVIINYYTDAIDQYGQTKQTLLASVNDEMTLVLYAQTPVSDVRFNDVEIVAITGNPSITEENEVVIDGDKYAVLKVIPSPRMTQLFLRKK